MNTVLSNRFYWGLMRYKGQERMGKHEPATDQLTWHKCQEVTAQHNIYATRSRKHRFLLTGLVRCKTCGNFLTQTVVSRRAKRYYHCTSRACCKEPYVDMEYLDSEVERRLQQFKLSEQFIDRVVVKVREQFASRWEHHEKERDSLVRQRVALEDRRNSAEQKLLSGVLTDEAFRRHMPPIQAELALVARRLEELEGNRSLDTDALREILLFARDLPTAIRQAPAALKRRYIMFFYREILTQGGKMHELVPTEFFGPLLNGKLFEQSTIGSGYGSLIEHFLALFSNGVMREQHKLMVSLQTAFGQAKVA
jgi:site-specific DNA recombinase